MGYFGIPFRNGVPIGLGSIVGFGAQQFDPSELFVGGTAGAWYDPSDLSTLFTTSAGTTPVAMPGQGAAVPVGLMLDKSQNGVGTNGAKRVNLLTYSEEFDNGAWGKTNSTVTANTAIAPDGTATADKAIPNNGATTAYISRNNFSTNGVFSFYAKPDGFDFIGGEISTTTGFPKYRVNLLTGECSADSPLLISTQNVANGWWRVSITGNFGSNASVITPRNDYVAAFSGIVGADGVKGIYIWGADLRVASEANTQPTYQRITDTWYSTLPGNHAISFNNTTARPELRARVNLLVATATLSTQSVTTQAATYTLSFAGTGSITLSGTATGSYSAGTHTITCTAGTLTLTVSGTVTTADLRPANSGALLPAYQAVVDANTYDTSGFPLYLLFEGAVGQRGMYTPANLNLSGTDKVSVFAGVRKLSDAVAYPTIAELSVTASGNDGAFAVFASGNITPRYAFYLRGTAVSGFEPQTYAAPVSNVLACAFDIAGAARTDEIQPNIDGVLNQTNPVGSANAGTGNFGTYPLYIGSRANSSLWLNGQIYSLIIAGSAVSAGNISATEQWVAGKTGIVIP